MSQAAGTPERSLASKAAFPPYVLGSSPCGPIGASPEYLRFRKLVDAAIGYAPPTVALEMLEAVLSEHLQQAIQTVSVRPEWLRGALEQKADVQVLEFLRANGDHLGRSSTVHERFGIAPSTLHRENSAGRAIAYRPSKKDDFLYPLEQFERGRVLDWPAEVVGAVGNGAAALHFLYVPRKQLDNHSFAQALREPGERDVAGLIRKTADRLRED
jgi:hypothetical protein